MIDQIRRRMCLALLCTAPSAGLLLPNLTQASHVTRSKRVYSHARPSYRIQLPADHGAHPDFRNEWWYFTGILNSPIGELGLQITFFRSAPDVDVANPSRFSPSQLWFGHLAIASPKHGKLIHDQAAWRGPMPTKQGQALNIQWPNWTLSTVDGHLWRCVVNTREIELDLKLTGTQTPWLQGDAGYSKKGPSSTEASHYITLPFMQADGQFRAKDFNNPATALSGSMWMDHEWSTEVLSSSAQGWDWVGMLFDDGSSLMAFQIRPRVADSQPIWTHAARRNASGRVQTFRRVQFEPIRWWTSPRTGVKYPVEQRLILDGEAFQIRCNMDDQELDARTTTGTLYWEGACLLKNAKGQPSARGYLEMTGYDRPMSL